MRHRTQEELLALALEAAKRDIALLRESGLPLSLVLVKAMARKAGEEQAKADLSAPDDGQQEHRKQKREPLSLAEYVQTLPHWRKQLCTQLDFAVYRTGFTVGIWLDRAVRPVSNKAGYWLYKTMHDVSYDAGFWLYVVLSGYPWNKYRKVHRSQQNNEN